MSATNRGATRKDSDFYATPLNSIYAFLDVYNGIKSTDLILEPSAGNGNIITALRNKGYTNPIHVIELREEERSNLVGKADKVGIFNYLTEDIPYKYDVIIGNPPYSLAREFIDKSLTLLNPGGRLIFLLRTAFLESKKRFQWWQKHPLCGLYTLHNRPSFTGKGTDATAYSWFVWERSDNVSQVIKVI